MGRGLAVGDLDNDGRLDVLILSHNQPLAYLHNRTKGGRFLSLRLVGRQSNRDAVGAKVVVDRRGPAAAWPSALAAAVTNRRRTRGSTSAWARPTGSSRSRSRGRQAQWTAIPGSPADTGYLLREGEETADGRCLVFRRSLREINRRRLRSPRHATARSTVDHLAFLSIDPRVFRNRSRAA